MGMRPPTGEHLDTAMPINHLRHPRTGVPVELPVVFSGGLTICLNFLARI